MLQSSDFERQGAAPADPDSTLKRCVDLGKGETLNWENVDLFWRS